MELDPGICERARQARDPRFDGRFFVGVRTTGIYCRPICPVRLPRPENVEFHPSAAAAEDAGFRPCRRCRPEASPGTPAWLGTSATVSRALRLIADGALDRGGVESLAGRLGIGGRHLTRLFRRHLGASPGAVARTRRLHFARRLVDETDWSLTRVAGAAGFGSVRRFNEAFRRAYGGPPSALRRRGRPPRRDRGPRLRLAYRPPFDWPALAAFLAARALPGVERADAAGYARTFALDGRCGVLHVAPHPDADALELWVEGEEPVVSLALVERVRRLFDLGADPDGIRAVLARDPGMAALVAARPGLRVPGAFCGFEMAVRAIVGQQVSVASARTFAGRIADRHGAPLPGAVDPALSRLFPGPEGLADAPLERLGLVGARAEAVRRLAAAVVEGRVVLDGGQGADALEQELAALPGIGRWTAQVIAMRALSEPDAWPDADLGLARALAREPGARARPAEMRARAEAWRPWRAYAAVHLWTRDAEAAGAARRSAAAVSGRAGPRAGPGSRSPRARSGRRPGSRP